MRTSDETIRWLERGVSIDADWREVAKDLRDLAAMEQRDRDGPCYYCGEPTQRFAGAPSRWPVYLCHADEPGVAKPHHAGCVSERLKERDAAIRERDEARAAFDKYGEHFQNCATNAFQQFDPGPPRRWKYGGEWMSSIPTCTCGLDAAIGGQG